MSNGQGDITYLEQPDPLGPQPRFAPPDPRPHEDPPGAMPPGAVKNGSVEAPERGRYDDGGGRAGPSPPVMERVRVLTAGAAVTIAPDIAFQHTANVAAGAVEHAPPFVSYRVATHASAPALKRERDVVRAVAVRTSDDLAVVQDLPRGANALAHGFPVTPNFDALSYFTLSWKVGYHGEVSSYVHDITPLRYNDTASSADVVVVRLRQYRAEYADDSSAAPEGKTHIKLVPYDFVKKQVVRPDSTFFLSDLYIDNATQLPSQVRYEGGNDIVFLVDYDRIEGHWLVTHAHYEETLHGPLRIGSLHVIADAHYDRFAFPVTAPDPRLVPPAAAATAAPVAAPAPAPAASAS